MNRESTFGLRAEQLAELLSVSLEVDNSSDKVEDDGEIGALLIGRLELKMPKDSYVLDSILTMLGQLGCDLKHVAGKSLGELLLDPETNVGLLQAIKDHCKAVSDSLVSEAEASAATAVYYAAAAGSIVYHDQKISRHSYEVLSNSFKVLAQKTWMPPELARLFARASKICKEKYGDK